MWSEQQKLLASDGAAGDRFGWDIDIYHSVIVVCAKWEDGKASDSGVYVILLTSLFVFNCTLLSLFRIRIRIYLI